MPDPGMPGIGSRRCPDQDEIERPLGQAGEPDEEVEQLRAAFVGVDPSDVDQVGTVEPEGGRGAFGLGGRRNLRTDSDGDAGDVGVAVEPLMSARSSGELYVIARTPRSTAPKISSPSAGSRSVVGTSTARSGATWEPWNAR